MPFDASEFMTLVIVVGGYISALLTYIHFKETKWFAIAYTGLVLGIIYTTASNLFFPQLLTQGQGIEIAIIGILFFSFAYQGYRHTTFLRKKMEDLDREG